jgi:hypothetical protein
MTTGVISMRSVRMLLGGFVVALSAAQSAGAQSRAAAEELKAKLRK